MEVFLGKTEEDSINIKYKLKFNVKEDGRFIIELEKVLNNFSEDDTQSIIFRKMQAYKIQSCVRKWLYHKRIEKNKTQVAFTILQSFIRMWLTKKNIQQFQFNSGWRNFKQANRNKSKPKEDKAMKDSKNENPVPKKKPSCKSSSNLDVITKHKYNPKWKTKECKSGDNCIYHKNGVCCFLHKDDKCTFCQVLLKDCECKI